MESERACCGAAAEACRRPEIAGAGRAEPTQVNFQPILWYATMASRPANVRARGTLERNGGHSHPASAQEPPVPWSANLSHFPSIVHGATHATVLGRGSNSSPTPPPPMVPAPHPLIVPPATHIPAIDSTPLSCIQSACSSLANPLHRLSFVWVLCLAAKSPHLTLCRSSCALHTTQKALQSRCLEREEASSEGRKQTRKKGREEGGGRKRAFSTRLQRIDIWRDGGCPRRTGGIGGHAG